MVRHGRHSDVTARLLAQIVLVTPIFNVYFSSPVSAFKLATYISGRYLSREEEAFVELLHDELQGFQQASQGGRALLFPAVDPRHRYLIHSTVQDHFPALTSVSVGEGDQRRTAVSFRSSPSPTTTGEHQDRGPGTPLHQHGVEHRRQCVPSPSQKQPQRQQQQTEHSTQKPEVPQASPSQAGSQKHITREFKPQQKQSQQPQQNDCRRSRSNSSSSQSVPRDVREDSSPQHDSAPQHSTTDTQKGKSTIEETHSKRRRNRKNKRHKDKAEQPQQERNSENVNRKGTEKHRDTAHPRLNREIETATVQGHTRGSSGDPCNGVGSPRVTRGQCNLSAEGTQASEGGIRKKLKSIRETSGTCKNSVSVTRAQGSSTTSREECEARLCGSGGSTNTSPSRQAHTTMPVTMPPENSNNRRRVGKASAQIYRPPPARGSHEESSPSPLHQQAKQPHPNHCHYQEGLGYHTYPVVSRQRTDSECSTATTASDIYNKGRGRRPDQVLYVPRGRRHAPADTSSARATPTPLQDFEPLARPPSPTYSICSVASEYSGRNRYSRQGSQLSLYDGETENRVKGKPPQSKGETSGNRENTAGNPRHQKGGGGGNRFSSQTYQLIERCLNQDADHRHSEDGETFQECHKGLGGQKSPTPVRDMHSIHSKENIITPPTESGRRSRKRRSRRRHSRSREPSSDPNRVRVNEQQQQHNGQGDRGFGSCERVFYNSSYNGQERYDRGYDNYDRYSSSRASSRNPSLERSPYNHSHNHNLSWRAGGSNPMSPSKGSTPYCPPHTRGSPGKPPSGRLGSLPNVALDLGESRGSTGRDTSEHCHTLPGPHLHRTTNARTNTATNSKSEQTVNSTSRVSEDSIRTSEVPKEQSTCEPVPENNSTCDAERVVPETQATVLLTATSQNSTGEETQESPSNEVHSRLTRAEENSDAHDTAEHSDHNDSITEVEPLPNELTEAREQSDSAPSAVTEKHQTDDHAKKTSKKFAFNWADEVEDSWDSLYDDTGECLDPDLKQQLSDTIGKVKLEKPVNDYYQFQAHTEAATESMNEDDYAHVIEIYDFPTSFRTQDIMMVFGQFQANGFDIKWVDDTHALGIFSTALAASEALNLTHPFLKTRALSMATKSSKAKAMRITDALLPYKPRPATSAALARRLVSGALGLKVNISREVREAERQKLKDAKARKRLEAKQRLDAWEGNLT